MKLEDIEKAADLRATLTNLENFRKELPYAEDRLVTISFHVSANNWRSERNPRFQTNVDIAQKLVDEHITVVKCNLRVLGVAFPEDTVETNLIIGSTE